MALPTPTELKSLDYAYQAQPFVDVPSKDAIDIKTMDWAYQAQPFVRNYSAGGVTQKQVTDSGSGTDDILKKDKLVVADQNIPNISTF